MTCTKRSYESEQAAKKAHFRAGYRLRVYRCPECHAFHTTNADKTPRLDWRDAKPLRRRSARTLAPERTLAEVEAIAAQMRARAS